MGEARRRADATQGLLPLLVYPKEMMEVRAPLNKPLAPRRA